MIGGTANKREAPEVLPLDVRVREPFDAFYRAEYPKLIRVLFGMTGRWGLAEEIAQEAMLSAYQKWTKVQSLDRPDLWLRRVAVNRAISTHRRTIAEIAALARLPVATHKVELPPLKDEAVWRHVKRLPPRQRVALVLWAVEGHTLADIGEVIGCSEETARTHLRRARERLRARIEEETI